MPVLISRAEALSRIEAEGGRPACLMCAVRDRAVGDVHAVFEDRAMLVMLPRYVRRWGHLMVMPKDHVTSFTEVDEPLWSRANALAHKSARVIERVLLGRFGHPRPGLDRAHRPHLDEGVGATELGPGGRVPLERWAHHAVAVADAEDPLVGERRHERPDHRPERPPVRERDRVLHEPCHL